MQTAIRRQTRTTNTDFGVTAVAGGLVTHNFSIANSGADPLTLDGGSLVAISGAHASDFTVTVDPSATVASSGSTPFTIVFNPSATGPRTATVTIENDDPDEDPYTFDIAGSGLGVEFWTDDFESTAPSPTGDRNLPDTNHADADDGTQGGFGDYFFRTSDAVDIPNGLNNTFTNIQDSSYWRAEDIDDIGGGVVNPGVIEWTGIDISGRSELTFTGFFGADDGVLNGFKVFETADFVTVEAQVDSNGFETILEFRGDNSGGAVGNLRVDTDMNGVGDGRELTTALANLGPALITGTGSLLTLRITVSSDIALKEIAFDQFALQAAPLPEVTLSLSANAGTEDAGTVITVTATADKPVVGNQTVTVGASGPGITAGDFALSDTTITIPNGLTSGQVTFTIQDDSVLEATETATIEISSPSAGILLGTPVSDTVDITDNDTATADLSVTTQGAESPLTNVVYTVTLSKVNNTGSAITFDLDDLGSGSATSGTDYTVISGTATISVADGQSTGTLTVLVSNDGLLEGTETIDAQISNPSNAAVTINTATATANILDDETATASLAGLAGNEDGSFDVDFQVTLSTVNNTGAPITFDLDDLLTGTATSGIDYTAVAASATISVANGETQSPFFSVFVTNDGLLEATETIDAQISNSSNPAVTINTATASANILDDDTATADLSVTTQGDETGPDDIVYTVTLSKTNNTGSTITFDLDDLTTGSATSGDDYTAISGSATISVADGQSTGTLTVLVTDDMDVEGTEDVHVQISNSSNPAVTIGTGTATANITDNDAEIGNFVFDDANGDGDQSGDSGRDGVTVNLLNAAGTTQLDTTTTAGGGLYSFIVAPGTYIVEFEKPSGRQFSPQDAVPENSDSDADTTTGRTGQITVVAGQTDDSNDAGIVAFPEVNLVLDLNAGTEAGTTVVTVTAQAAFAVTGNQTVDVAVTGTGITAGDYTLSNTTITILNGMTSGSVDFTVKDDAVVEALTETALLTISNPSAGIVLGTTDSDTVDITDNDMATISIGNVSSSETNSGTTSFTFTVTLDLEVDGSVGFDFETIDGTATTGDNDYIGIGSTSRNFASTAAGATETVTVQVNGDTDIETKRRIPVATVEPRSSRSRRDVRGWRSDAGRNRKDHQR